MKLFETFRVGELLRLPRWVPYFIALVVFGFYLRLMAPTITAGDSAELSTAQATLGIAHSPGYPLFVLWGKALQSAIPFGSPAYRTNIASLLCLAVLTGFLTAFLAFLLNGILLPILAVLFLVAAPVFAEQFLGTEVFALNSLLVLSLCACLLIPLIKEDFEERAESFLNLAAFIFGIGLGNQHTLILLAPAFALTAIILFWRGNLSGWIVLTAPFFFLLGFSIYLFLPIRSLSQPLLDWEDPQTWDRFLDVLRRARYGTFQLAQGAQSSWSLARLTGQTGIFLKQVLRQFGWPGALWIGGGLAFLFYKKRKRTGALVLSAAIFCAGPFFWALSNATGPNGQEIVLRFLPMPLLLLVIAAAWGWSSRKIRGAAALGLVACLPFLSIASSQRSRFLVHDYARDLLKTVPPGSLLFADRADEMEFALAYFLNAEGLRKDMRFVDCNAGVTRSVYGDNYYRIWGKPRLARRLEIERERIARETLPVYYATVEPSMIPEVGKKQDGLLYRASYLSKDSMDQREFYVLRTDFSKPGFRENALQSTYLDLMGKWALSVGDISYSIQNFSLLCAMFPERSPAHVIALDYLNRNLYGPAELFFQKALLNDLERDKVYCNLGALYEKTGKSRDAEAQYRHALESNPQSSQAHYNLGALYWKENRWKDVIREFEEVLRLDPQRADAANYLKVALRKSER